jgi:hypothetical protein
MHLRHFTAVVLTFLVLRSTSPFHAAGFTNAITSPLQSIVLAIESSFPQLVALIEPHRTMTDQIAAAPWHAPGRSTAAAVFNAVAATTQPKTVAAAVTAQHLALADSKPAETAAHRSSCPRDRRQRRLIASASSHPSNINHASSAS